MKNKNKKTITLFAVLIILALDFLFFKIDKNKSWGYLAYEKYEYNKILNEAEKYYSNYNQELEIDEYLLLKLIAIKEGKFGKFLNQDFDDNPFGRIIDKNDQKIEISRNFISLEEIDSKVNSAEFKLNNNFYSIDCKDCLKDPWDDIMLKSLYCDSDYGDLDFKILQLLNNGKGGYLDTHFLLGLMLLNENKCINEDIYKRYKDKVVGEIVRAQKEETEIYDLFAERAVFLYWAGAGEKVERDWVDKLKEEIYSIEGSHFKGLALLAIIYNEKGNKKEAFYN